MPSSHIGLLVLESWLYPKFQVSTTAYTGRKQMTQVLRSLLTQSGIYIKFLHSGEGHLQILQASEE